MPIMPTWSITRMQRRVWIVSPTTLMAVLNTARAVLKDVETRKQMHIIKDELGKLGREFGRFDERMRKLADHIRQAHEDAQQVQISSRKISERFAQHRARRARPGRGAAAAGGRDQRRESGRGVNWLCPMAPRAGF